MRKRLLVLGSTGSVGRNVLDVVAHHPDHFEIVGLSSRSNAQILGEQCGVHRKARFLTLDPEAHRRLTAASPDMAERAVEPGQGSFATLIEVTAPDLVVNCLMGFVGLKPTLDALGAGIPVALANKESVVTGGELLIDASKRSGASIIPIDSEHVALSQCLAGSNIGDVKQVFLTASGGALRDRSIDEIAEAGINDVLAHPTWRMGDKITVDSATLLNKGFEVIEARWLFGLPLERIKVVIHPQSIIHCLVEFKDNSILAQMGIPDMRLPILYALTYPGRIETSVARSRITDFPSLTLREVDDERYPCFSLALRAARAGGNTPTVLNSANEVAVGAFLAGNIRFSRIYDVIESALDHVPSSRIGSFEDVMETDRRTREYLKREFGI
ncbi:MAG: 1-deoxy-D-xylulose 5-phosphate reductoisomerase [Candidatus Krumholzibacteriota bacterium]|nr:1-deoxy-D-xylulose 5-phosphate reductoisomerase [Candidatus Krumholzibacteriota bacterium]